MELSEGNRFGKMLQERRQSLGFSAAGLGSLTEGEIEAFERYNAEYRARFGFPFVICARTNRKEAILSAFPARLRNDRKTEIETAIEQIGEIAWLRMSDAISEGADEWLT